MVTACVDVNLVLENLKREDMQVGAWLNVVGYVEGVGKTESQGRSKDGVMNGGQEVMRVKVKAVMLWSAGALDLGKYERALEGRLGAEGRKNV